MLCVLWGLPFPLNLWLGSWCCRPCCQSKLDHGVLTTSSYLFHLVFFHYIQPQFVSLQYLVSFWALWEWGLLLEHIFLEISFSFTLLDVILKSPCQQSQRKPQNIPVIPEPPTLYCQGGGTITQQKRLLKINIAGMMNLTCTLTQTCTERLYLIFFKQQKRANVKFELLTHKPYSQDVTKRYLETLSYSQLRK